ncbi:MAG: aldo/keto reductase [Treponema sp.]|nr:aldo/keto reductase [Treponema sp.]
MEYIALGKSNLMVSRTAFGAMSLKDIANVEDAVKLVHQAYDDGINFFDTAHSTPESEKRLGSCLHGIRQNVILATKSSAKDATELVADLEDSLIALQSDYVDLFQYETENIMPEPDGKDGIYKALIKLKQSGKIRHIGLTSQTHSIAYHAILNGLYEAIQYPFNVLTDETSQELVTLAQEYDVGFIAMKPLYSGLVQNIPLAFGFLHQYENVVPVWGVRTSEELKQILYFEAHPPIIDDAFKEELKHTHDFFN